LFQNIPILKKELMTKSSKENKPYTVTFKHCDGYLYAYAQGKEDSYEISVGYWTDIAMYCKENGFSKVIVEEDFETDTSIIDKYELMSHGHDVGLTGVKIAFVDRHSEQMKSNQFGETAALNRGLIVKVFSNIKEAEAWLLS
jgi:hypothetical protein